MKTLILALTIFTGALGAHAQTIDTGCFQFGPNNCDLSQNPPSINTGGFQYGPHFVTAQTVGLRTLPNCPPNPNGGFSLTYNLFDDAVSGIETLKATSSCTTVNIKTGALYDLVADTDQFAIYDDTTFYTIHPVSVVHITTPSQGVYLTNDTCSSPIIDSNEIREGTLKIMQSQQGIVSIQRGADSCDLKVCPKFGPCN